MSEKQKILAVDDEPRNLKILLLGLGTTDWDIKTASTGEEALEILNSFIPDIVLLDIMMPGMDGYEVCKKIKQIPAMEFTKIILVSGKAMLEERLKGYEVGADDYITKPFISEELSAKVKVFMRLVLVERQLKDLNMSLEEKVRERTEQLMNAEAKLINSAKMSALGEMAGGIAHEVNTPLGVITLLSGQIQELMEETPLDIPAIVKLVGTIDATADRISKIILGLRTFSREDKSDNFQMTSLDEIVQSTLTLCAEKFKNNNVPLIVEPIPKDLALECRAVQISQVLLNLLNNAYDAVEKLPDKWVKISARIINGNVKISVTDSGTSISKEMQEKIFQPFFTTKEVNKGTGLGLSISKGLIESHRGSLSIDTSAANTCFLIDIPQRQLIKAV